MAPAVHVVCAKLTNAELKKKPAKMCSVRMMLVSLCLVAERRQESFKRSTHDIAERKPRKASPLMRQIAVACNFPRLRVARPFRNPLHVTVAESHVRPIAIMIVRRVLLIVGPGDIGLEKIQNCEVPGFRSMTGYAIDAAKNHPGSPTDRFGLNASETAFT